VSFDAWLPLLIVFSSFATGLIIFFLDEESHRLRTMLNLLGATLKVALVGLLIWGVYHDLRVYEFRQALLPDLDFVLRADALSVLFVTLSAVLWLVTTIYAVGYLEDSPDRSRFFGVFSLCVSATTGIALSGNLVTFLIFYECLTLTTYPLVVHRGTKTSLHAGRAYLAYTMAGGMLVLLGTVWLHTLVGPVEFRERGVLAAHAAAHRRELIVLFAVLVGGLGVKAALVPVHGWLPQAMVAPAPVSALLHAVAVVKAGAFGIVRVVYDVYGVEFAEQLGVLAPLSAAAAVTIIYGSLRAVVQDDLKRRLAYSTVSQVSYIALGAATFGPVATLGGLVHLVHQGVMKITLFFCAGNYAETLGVHKVSELNGVGRRMPWTTAAFTVGALGMIGVPPLAGFFSKWFLGLGVLAAHKGEIIVVLAASSLLNAIYFLPILHAAWFKAQQRPWPAERPAGRLETHWMLLAPPLATATLVVAFGLFAGSPLSPLQWAQLIVQREYGP
jgi:multicomponent Na+:H+ antiporter subunit D